MPNNDGTGPQGRGKLTGRGFGNCRMMSNGNMMDEDIEFARYQSMYPRFGRGYCRRFRR